jgi:hypothetical protein
MQEEDGSVTNHAKICFISISAVYEVLKQWNNGDRTIIPKGCEKEISKINRDVRTNNFKSK